MSLSALESSLLWLGIEDYTGLWDAAHQVRSALSTLGELEAITQARVVVSGLAHRELIALYRCIGTLADGQVTDVAAGEVDSVLEDERSWKTPETPFGESIWYATTDAGQSLYSQP